ncbi:MAG TPA: acyl-CoA dehydrogenase family protein [Micromonosporaceae bacterium]
MEGPAEVIDLLYTEVEDELRAGVRAMLSDRSPARRVLARVEGDEPYDPTVWRALGAEMGLAGLAVPESRGGAGASWREVAVVCEELGRAVTPAPYLGSAVIATGVLLALDDPLLAELAGGARTAALAVPFGTAPGSAARLAAAEDGVVSGEVRGVADAATANVLLVPATDGLYAVEAVHAARRPVVSLDLTRPLCDVTLDAAPGRRLAAGERATAAIEAGLRAGAAMLASEQLGVAEWCLGSTVDYLKVRHQFGRPVGSFQAIKHRLADVWVGVTQARAVARYAAGCLAAGDPDAPIATALAQAHCGPVAVTAAEECVQLHGGIGFTWEHPAHLYLKRAKADAIALGTADRHRARLASLVDLPVGAAPH